MPNYYATFDETIARMTAKNAIIPALLMSYIETASRQLDQTFASRRPYFQPYYETRRVLVRATHVNSHEQSLRLDSPLLSISAVTAGTTVLAANTDVVGYPDVTMPPFYRIALSSTLSTCGYSWQSYAPSTLRQLNVSLTGFWGMSTDYGNSALAVDALAADMTISQTSMTVADINGENVYGIAPRISPGALVWLETELVEVTDANISTNVATIRRAVNGTTAAIHLTGVAVKVFQVDDLVRQEVARQAGFLYARAGSYNTVEARDMVEIHYPPHLLTSFRTLAYQYHYYD